jgi:hypothetical protein
LANLGRQRAQLDVERYVNFLETLLAELNGEKQPQQLTNRGKTAAVSEIHQVLLFWKAFFSAVILTNPLRGADLKPPERIRRTVERGGNPTESGIISRSNVRTLRMPEEG